MEILCDEVLIEGDASLHVWKLKHIIAASIRRRVNPHKTTFAYNRGNMKNLSNINFVALQPVKLRDALKFL